MQASLGCRFTQSLHKTYVYGLAITIAPVHQLMLKQGIPLSIQTQLCKSSGHIQS